MTNVFSFMHGAFVNPLKVYRIGQVLSEILIFQLERPQDQKSAPR